MKCLPMAVCAVALAVGCSDRGPFEVPVAGSESPHEKVEPAVAAADGPAWFVTRVIDGDTLVARLEEPGRARREETIRLLRIDTPEKEQPLFDDAREALKELVKGGEIKLVHEDSAVEKRGNYGRLLAYVYVDDVNVNVEMVRLGWSRFWTKYGRGRFGRQFQTAEVEARREGRGLWR